MSHDVERGLAWNPALINSLADPKRIEVLSDDSGESQAVIGYLTARAVEFREVHRAGRIPARPVLIYSENGVTIRLQGTPEIAAFLLQKHI